MSKWNRRQWVAGVTAAAAGVHKMAAAAPQFGEKKVKPTEGDLLLTQFEPKSMLHVHESKVERPRFPVIDMHTHLSWSPGFSDNAPQGGKERLAAPISEVIPVMDRRDLKVLVNLTGGFGTSLDQSIEMFVKPYPDRFVVFTEPWYQKLNIPNYPQFQADQVERAHKIGAKGLKVLKTLGLFLRENITTGDLVKIDDKRYDPMWEACAALNMPVLIHVSDPEAFFLPIDRYNERYEELHNHPDWSFYGNFPSNRELHEARNRVIARHPKTQFILAHVGDSENLAWVSEWLDKYPNMHVDFAARIGELGRQPRNSRKFFEKYQDRIVFGTDAVPRGDEYPQQVYGDLLYQIYYRFLETEDEYFDYAPAKVPPQGRWRIYGIGLPEGILRKVYHENAERLLGIKI